MANATITSRQRHIDKAGTQPLEGWFNVYLGRKYIGVIYAVGDQWQWGGLQHERCASFDEAVRLHVELYQRHHAA